MVSPNRSEPLKTGQRPVQQTTRTYKSGETVFEEGAKTREMFIVQDGKVAIYKNTPTGEVLLAYIEKGGVIGEMSLLDNMPRSATVRAVELSTLIVINPLSFFIALKTVPGWLSSIINIVIGRLRDANQQVDQVALRDPETGIVPMMLLLLAGHKHTLSSTTALDYDLVLEESHTVCRLKKEIVIKTISAIEKRKIITIELDQSRKKHIAIPDIEILRLYDEYLVLKKRKKSFPETTIPDQDLARLDNKEAALRIRKIKEWLPCFEASIL
jgi:CRP/FNR family cyclic AMP-dependent transcriptional regulator